MPQPQNNDLMAPPSKEELQSAIMDAPTESELEAAGIKPSKVGKVLAELTIDGDKKTPLFKPDGSGNSIWEDFLHKGRKEVEPTTAIQYALPAMGYGSGTPEGSALLRAIADKLPGAFSGAKSIAKLLGKGAMIVGGAEWAREKLQGAK